MLKELIYVFTKEYREECLYREFLKSKVDSFKLSENEEDDVDKKIKRLKQAEFVSNFSIKAF